MGLDISMHAERFNDDGNWELVPRRFSIDRRSPLFFVLSGTCRMRACLEGVEPISPPRGLPPDLSPGVTALVWERCTDPTWLWAEELANWDWDQTIQRKAMVTREAAILFEDNPIGFPWDQWPEGVDTGYAMFGAGSDHVQWREPIADTVKLDQLKTQLGELWGDRKVRVVFWYG